MTRYPGIYLGGTVRREALAGVGLQPLKWPRLLLGAMSSKYFPNMLQHRKLAPSDSDGLVVSDLPSRKPDPGIANPLAGQCWWTAETDFSAFGHGGILVACVCVCDA